MPVRNSIRGEAFYPKSGTLIDCANLADQLPDLLKPHVAVIRSTNHIHVTGLQLYDSHALVMTPLNDDIASTLARNAVKTGIGVMLMSQKKWGYAAFLSTNGSPLSSSSATALCRCSIRAGKRPKPLASIDERHCVSLRIAAAMDIHNIGFPRSLPPSNGELLDSMNMTLRQLRLRANASPEENLKSQIEACESLIAKMKSDLEDAARRSAESTASVERLLEVAAGMPPAFALPFAVETK